MSLLRCHQGIPVDAQEAVECTSVEQKKGQGGTTGLSAPMC